MRQPDQQRLHVALVVGTRPEAIKLAPVALALLARPAIQCTIWCTGQHKGWAPEMLAFFGLAPDRLLEPAPRGPGLGALTAALLDSLDIAIREDKPDVLIVQGDTSSAFAGTLAAAYAGVPAVHVEAGLRSPCANNPFPEEAHRRSISHFAALHCAPTKRACAALQAEGVEARNIVFSGNTAIDALHAIGRRIPANDLLVTASTSDSKLILVTCHRRESWGDPYLAICRAIQRIAEAGGCEIVFVMHPNPLLADTARRILGGQPNIQLVSPLGYPDFVQLISRAALILSDSGGVQEEAGAIGTPLLVLRTNTERPEAVEAGSARIIGCSEDVIVKATRRLLDQPQELDAMRCATEAFGDGLAAERIADAIEARWIPAAARLAAAQINAEAATLALKVPA